MIVVVVVVVVVVSASSGGSAEIRCTSWHTEIEVVDLTFYITKSQYTDTGPASPIADPRTAGVLPGSP